MALNSLTLATAGRIQRAQAVVFNLNEVEFTHDDPHEVDLADPTIGTLDE